MSDHGGNVYDAARRTGISLDRIVDFSASINPLGMPRVAGQAIREAMSRIHHYPEPYGEELGSTIASRVGLDPEMVICGNGSAELIYLVPRVLQTKIILIPEPTFREYERACRIGSQAETFGFRLRHENNFDLLPEDFALALRDMAARAALSNRPAAAFLCNPNNPTGRIVPREGLLEIAKVAKELQCYLIVDEAFIDFRPDESVSLAVRDNPYLIVLRSMTKFYAIPGLRIGYGLFHPSVAARVREQKEPWTINSLAEAAGLAVLNDVTYEKESSAIIKREKKFLEEGLKELQIAFVPSVANYYLLHLPKAQEVRKRLEEEGILVRDCSNFAGLDGTYLRIAVRTRRENRLLLKEMGRICAVL